MFLKSKLKKWIEADLITDSTAEAILNFEKKGTSNNVLYGILWLGALSIIVGIISIIAANWNEIPKSVKLTVDFLWLIALAVGVFKSQSKSPFIFELYLFILFGSIMGTIALIGQIYHLESHLFFSFGLWLLIGTPLVLYSKVKYSAHAWTCLYVVTLFLGHSYFFPFNLETSEPSLSYVPLILIYTFFLFKKFAPKDSYFTDTLFKSSLVVFFVFIMIMGSVRWASEIQTIDYYHKMILLMLFLPMVWIIAKEYALELALILVIGFGYAEIPNWFIHDGLKLVGAFYFLFFFVLLAHWGIRSENRRIFEFSIFMISLRIIIVYFEVFGSLLQTGIGLVSTGVFILLVGYLWYTKKEKLWKRKA